MVMLEPIDLKNPPLVHLSLAHHTLDNQGEHHCRRGEGCGSLVPWHLLARGAQREPDLPLAQRLHQHPHDGEHGQRGHPFRFLKPPGGEGRRMFDPTKPWVSRGVLLLIGLSYCGLSTHLSAYRRREAEPPRLVLSLLQGRGLSS